VSSTQGDHIEFQQLSNPAGFDQFGDERFVYLQFDYLVVGAPQAPESLAANSSINALRVQSFAEVADH
jgi:hypothetical protein